MVETSVTPMSSAAPVAATRRGFFWMFACAILALGPASETSAPMPRMSAGSQNVADRTMPRKMNAQPAMAMSSTVA